MAKQTKKPLEERESVAGQEPWKLADYPWGIPEPILITKKFGPLSMNGKVVQDPRTGEEVPPPTEAQMKALYDHSRTKAKYFTPPKGYTAPWESN